MAASSVSGVGVNSALKSGQKGSESMFLGVEKLIGPRIVRAGIGTCASNVLTVTFPESLDGVLTDYVVLVSAVSATASTITVHVTTLSVDSDSKFSSFAVYHDTAAGVFHWAVVRVSNATVTV